MPLWLTSWLTSCPSGFGSLRRTGRRSSLPLSPEPGRSAPEEQSAQGREAPKEPHAFRSLPVVGTRSPRKRKMTIRRTRAIVPTLLGRMSAVVPTLCRRMNAIVSTLRRRMTPVVPTGLMRPATCRAAVGSCASTDRFAVWPRLPRFRRPGTAQRGIRSQCGSNSPPPIPRRGSTVCLTISFRSPSRGTNHS